MARKVAIEVGGDVCDHEARSMILALGGRFGFDVQALRKATRTTRTDLEKVPDLRFPELTTLIRKARLDWRRWSDALIDAVDELVSKRGTTHPRLREELEELFAEHRVGFEMGWAGPRNERRRTMSTVELGYRSSRRRDVTRPPTTMQSHPTTEQIVREAWEADWTPRDEDAANYARARAAVYMRRPVSMVWTELDRKLSERELAKLRPVIAAGVRDRVSSVDLARDLRDAVQGTTLTNDMDRVARTELAFAHGFGGYVELKKQAEVMGDEDPWVYKQVSPVACRHCREIWGPPGNPNRYRLSHVEQREAAGGNFRLPADQWGPVFGPAHPHCTCGPLQYWNEAVHDLVEEGLRTLREVYGTDGT